MPHRSFSSRRWLLVQPSLHLLKLQISVQRLSTSLLHHHQTHSESSSSSATHHETADSLAHLIRQCLTIQHLQQIHAQVFLTGSVHSPFVAAGVVTAYSRYGFLGSSRNAFQTSPSSCFSSTLLWNSILRATVKFGAYEEAVKLYLRMRSYGAEADGFTYPLVIRACGYMGDWDLCRNVHTHVFLMGFQWNLHVGNELLGMYWKLGQTGDAQKVFDRMSVRSHISWNTMVSGFSLNYDCLGASEMFCLMESDGLEPNVVTWTSLLSCYAKCGRHEETLRFFGMMRRKGIDTNAEALAVVISVYADSVVFDKGEVLHGYVVKGGFGDYLVVENSLICMYGKHGAFRDAEKLFSEMKVKNLVSWNALISSYAESGLCDQAYDIFLELDDSNKNPLVRPNVVSWGAVIAGFAHKGRGEESLKLFRQMQLAQVLPNFVTISCVLSVCAELFALLLGKEIHGHVIKAVMDKNILVGNGLINMYTKCGNLTEANMVFHRFDGRDQVSWNLMIAGYGVHGLGTTALQTFEMMIKDGCKPDKVTFVAIISACSHAGLVCEGRKLFNRMPTEFQIEPEVEHYACMVDLLGRAGFLHEASELLRSMPIKPNAHVWGALLNSCRMYKNTDVAEEMASEILNLGSETTGSYTLLSNLYAETGRWDDSAKVRFSAKAKGLKKIPGQSWIDVKKKVYSPERDGGI